MAMKRPRQCRGLFLAAALNFAVEEPLSRFVIPAKAVIQRLQAFKTKALDYRLRWNDGRMELLGTPEDVTHADFAPAPHPACHSSFSPQAARRKSDKDSPRTGSRPLIRMQIKTPAYAGVFIVAMESCPLTALAWPSGWRSTGRHDVPARSMARRHHPARCRGSP